MYHLGTEPLQEIQLSKTSMLVSKIKQPQNHLSNIGTFPLETPQTTAKSRAIGIYPSEIPFPVLKLTFARTKEMVFITLMVQTPLPFMGLARIVGLTSQDPLVALTIQLFLIMMERFLMLQLASMANLRQFVFQST